MLRGANPNIPVNMLNRNDLAKQFELVVKQEIKNYQDSLNFVLQSIDGIKKDINQLHSDMLENYALIHSQHTDLTIQHENHNDKLNNFINQFVANLNNTQVFKEKMTNKLGTLWDSSLINSRKNEYNENRIKSIRTDFEKIEDEIIAHSFALRNTCDDMQCKLKKELSNMKEEILSRPSEALQLKSEFEEKINTHRIDVAGIMKELLVMKKENMITEKKLEHVYTLIDRLQKKAEENK